MIRIVIHVIIMRQVEASKKTIQSIDADRFLFIALDSKNILRNKLLIIVVGINPAQTQH